MIYEVKRSFNCRPAGHLGLSLADNRCYLFSNITERNCYLRKGFIGTHFQSQFILPCPSV